MRRILLAYLFLSAFVTAVAQSAQTPQTGLYEFGSFDNPNVDSINRGNLNVHLTIPIVSKAGRAGANFIYSLNYDSLVYLPTSVSGSSVWSPAANWGWTTESTAEFGYVSYNLVYLGVRCTGTNDYNWEGFVYHDKDGRSHPFNYSYSNGCNTPSLPNTTGTYAVNDNSGYTVYRAGNAFTIYTKDGAEFQVSSTQSFNGVSTPLPKVGIYIDTNGNEVTANSSGVFTDTLGKTVLTVSGAVSTTAASALSYSYTDTTGTARSVTVNYSIYSVATAFGTGAIEYSNTSVPLISSIVYPDSTQYSFTYEPTPGGSGTVTGRLASITLPTGGTISYAYTGGSNGIESDGSPSGLTRTTTDGATTYVRSAVTSTGSTTTFTDASNNVTTSTYRESTLGYSYEASRSIYAGPATGNPLQTVTTSYGSTGNCSTSSVEAPIACQSTQLTLNGIVIGNDVKTYSGGFLVSDNNGYRVETTGYQSFTGSNSIPFSKVSSVTDTTGSSQFAQTTYSYDQTTPTATSGLPQHSTVTGSRGNVTTVSPWLNTNNAVSGAITNTYYDTGSLLTSTTPNGASTYGYDGTGSYVTSLSPPTPSSGVSLASGATSDQNTGLPVTNTDPNGNQVAYKAYDSRLRPTEIDTLNSSGTLVGKTTYSYSANQTGVQTFQTPNASADTETLYDGYGRLSRVAVLNGQSTNQYYQQDSCYDANGRLWFQSYSYQGAGWSTAKVCSSPGATPTAPGETYTYDAVGRVTKITHGDGYSINYSYNGGATQTTDENNVVRIIQSDFMGRPTIACEVTSTALLNSGAVASCGTDISGSGYATTYSYNLATLTTTVSQGGQQRSFQTDSLGRTISVQEPESGTTTYSYAYNSTGLVVTRKRPTANQTKSSALTTTTTQYDSMRRVLSITYSDGTPTKSYAYDTNTTWPWTNFAPTNLKGRLYLAEATGSTTAATVFSYDALGRITSMDECLPSGCGNGAYDKILNYSYDLQGNMLSSTDGAGVTTSYNNYTPASEVGSITSSLTGSTHPTNLIYSPVYGPKGLIYDRLGNGLSQYNTYTIPGNINGSWVCNGFPSQACGEEGGVSTYAFIANWRGGDVTSTSDAVIGTSTNNYDNFGRLSGVSYNSGASTVSYTYDRWGNRLSQNASNGPSPSYTFNTANNQITSMSMTYDAAGNVTGDGFHAYSYDAENNLTIVDPAASNGPTATYTYDALNRRVRDDESLGSQEFVFNVNNQRVSIWNPANQALVQGQYFAGSKPIAFYTTASGQTFFQHQDWIGTERMRTTYNGAVAGTFTSLPFGDNFTVKSGTDSDAYHFASLDDDYTSGTSHAQFRQYSNTAGRWMSPDPYSGSYDLSNPQSMNRYTYALNSPTSLTDPSGQDYCQGVGGETVEDDDGGENDMSCQQTGGVWIVQQDPTNVTGTTADPCGSNTQCITATTILDPPVGIEQNPVFNYGISVYQSTSVSNLAAPSNGQEPPPACQAKILNATNNKFGTNYTNSNVTSTFNYSTGAGPGQGTLNLNISGSTSGVSTGYYPVHWYTYIIGYGPTLHVVGGDVLDNPQTLQFGPNQGTFHIDSGYPINPIGAAFHWLLNMTKAGGYPKC